MTPLWEKALEAQIAAHALLDLDNFNGAANRAYYAMFDAARCALRERTGIRGDATKRHSIAIGLFSQHFIRTGIVDLSVGRALSEAFGARVKADYSDELLTADDAREIVAATDKFIAAIRQLLELPE